MWIKLFHFKNIILLGKKAYESALLITEAQNFMVLEMYYMENVLYDFMCKTM